MGAIASWVQIPRMAREASTDRSYVGKNVRRLRENLDLTQEELAEKTDLTPEAISQIETGKRRGKVETLQTISRALGQSMSELFKASDASSMPQQLSEFLETSMAKDVTDVEVEQLRAVRVEGRQMTVESYYLALKMIRSTEPTQR